MTHEVSPKTEHAVLAALLRSGQMSLYDPGRSDSFIIPLEKLCARCGVARAELLQPFSAGSEVTHDLFTMRYEGAGDRVHFKRIKPPNAGAPTSPLAPVAAAEVPTVSVGSTPKTNASMSAEQVTAIAKQEWANDEKLRSEFTTEARYLAWRRAEVAGRARIFGKPRPAAIG
jgi:hypothetical protein